MVGGDDEVIGIGIVDLVAALGLDGIDEGSQRVDSSCIVILIKVIEGLQCGIQLGVQADRNPVDNIQYEYIVS